MSGSSGRYNRKTGVSVAEYALIGALLLGLSIGALMMLGQTINEMFSGMLQRPVVAQAPAGGGTGSIGGTGAPTGGNTGGPVGSGSPANGGGSQGAGSGNGSTVPETSTAPVQTAGGNGSLKTYQTVETLLALAAEVESEVGDANWAALIRQVANAGHTMGAAEQAIEEFCPPGGDCGGIDPDTGNYNPYTNKHLFNNLTTANTGFTDDVTTLKNYFEANYPPPDAVPYDIRKRVNDAIQVIFDVKTSGYGTSIVDGKLTYTGYTSPDGTTGSQQTGNQSNTICQTQPNHPSCTK